jgi:lipid-binding SYLF domain-containing protein
MHGVLPMTIHTPSVSRCLIAAGMLAAAAPALGCETTSARTPADEAAQRDDGAQEMRDSAEVLRALATTAGAIPASVRHDARCVAVVPSIVKAAFIVGGQYGRGVASCRTADSWSAPAFFSIGGGSFGLQVGVQSTDLVLYVMDDNGMRRLLNSRLELGAGASVAAGPVGRDVAAGTDWKMRAEILTYSRARGLFAGVDLGGAVLTQDHARASAVYGDDADYRALLEGRIPWPATGSELEAALIASDAPPAGPAVSAR